MKKQLFIFGFAVAMATNAMAFNERSMFDETNAESQWAFVENKFITAPAEYKKAVWKETGISYKKYKLILGERSRTRQLDHIYSILHGFRDSIDPLILGNIVNLRILDSKMNQSKSMNSDYTKEELMKLYEEVIK